MEFHLLNFRCGISGDRRIVPFNSQDPNIPSSEKNTNLRLIKHLLGRGFKYFLFSPLFGEDFHFDDHISSDVLVQPPTSLDVIDVASLKVSGMMKVANIMNYPAK